MSASKELPPLLVKLKGDGTQFNQFINTSVAKLETFGNKLNSLGNKWSLALSLPLGIMEATSISAFAGFNDAIVGSVAIMSGVTEDMQAQMEAVAMETSLSTTTSAKDIAEGYYFLASAGRDAANAMQSVATVDQFAVAGRMNMAKATEYLADAQSSLGLRSTDAAEDLKQLQRVADVITQAANKANASQVQFSDAITTKSGPALRGLNKDLEEGMAVLMVYADQGIKASLAGEKLDILYRELANAQREETAAWAAAGIALYDARGQMLPTAQVIGQLEQKLGKLSPQARGTALNMLGFRSEAISAIQPLLGLSDKLTAYEQDLRNAGGATKEVTEKQMASFNSQMALTKNQVNVLQIEIGKALVPTLMAKNAVLKQVLQLWGDLPWRVKVVAANLMHITAITGPMLVSVGMASFGIKSLITNMQTLGPLLVKSVQAVNAGLAAMRVAAAGALLPLLPYIAIAAAVAAAVAGIAYVLVGPEGIAAGWGYVKSVAANTWQTMLGLAENWQVNLGLITGWFRENWLNLLKDAGQAMLLMVTNNISNWVVLQHTGIRLFTAFIGWLTTAVPAAWDFVFSGKLHAAIIGGLAKGLVAVDAWLQGTITSFTIWAKGVYDQVAAVFGELTNLGYAMAMEVGKAITGILNGELPNPAEIMARLMDQAGPRLEAAMMKAGMATAAAMDKAKGAMDATVASLKSDFDKGAADLNFLNTAGDIVNDQLGKLKGPLDGFKSSVTELPQLVTSRAGEALADSTDAATQGLDKIGNKVQEIGAMDTTVTFGAKKDIGFDAVAAGTSEAADRVASYMLSKTKAAAGAAKGPQALATLVNGQPAPAGPTGVVNGNLLTPADDSSKKSLATIAANTKPPKNLIHIADANLVGTE